ncbi:MAG: aldose 1-epimerase [Pirellulales bacterium]|nr:aldose 1-epimerase [Pirellulales bacterium]
MAMERVELVDEASGSRAEVLVGRGFNCYRFIPQVDGREVDVLWSVPGFEKGEGRGSGSGIPLLFPFPGRIGGAKYEFGGKTYQLEANHGTTAIHGFVLERPWQLVEQTASRAKATFHAQLADPKLLELWPADFKISVTYQVQGRRLASTIEIENPDQQPLPFGFGTHPYFRVPLGEEGDAARCKITVPAASYWELADMLPTGRKLPVDDSRALAGGKAFAETKLDDVLDDLQFGKDGMALTRIEDTGSGRSMRMSFDRGFRACVVYNPPHREAICIEPYTCVPDPFVLSERGLDVGLRVLGPGERFVGEILIEVV